MRTIHSMIVVACVILVQVMAPARAHAYIDPGTGSMLVQAVIAALAAVGVGLGVFWRRVKNLFTHQGTEKERAQEKD